MKKDVLYVVLLIIGLVLGSIFGINISKLKSTSQKYSLALTGGENGFGFVVRMDNITGDVDVTYLNPSIDVPKYRPYWTRIGPK